MRIMKSSIYLIVILSILRAGSISAVEPPLSVDDLVGLASSGKSENEIVQELQNRGVAFEANVAVVQRLVDAGLSPGTLQVMLSVSGRNNPSEARVIAPLTQSVPGLFISTTPSGMDVFLNGEIQGVTPFLNNKLEIGSYIVRVQHPLFITKEKTVELSGKSPVVINWSMEPTEPIVRFNFELISNEEDYPWSWVVKSRQNCPDPVDLTFESAPEYSQPGTAVFTLSNESKATFQGKGQTCFELFLWRGKIRTDLSVKDLPSPVARYLISSVSIKGINYIDLNIVIEVNSLDPLHPVVTLNAPTGYLLDTQDKAPTVVPDELKQRMIETMGSLGQ